MKIRAYVVSAFTSNGQGGNKAGVVLDARNLSNEQMQKIAKELSFSETSFVSKSSIATRKLRFFTPTEEVDLCGHATIATWALLYQQDQIDSGVHTQETMAGNLGINIDPDGKVFMQQTQPTFFETVDTKEIADVLGIGNDDFNSELSPQVVSTGLKDLMVAVNDKSKLNILKPDFNQMIKLSEQYGVTGLHVFALNKQGQTIATARNFAPRVGIDEESATGTSNGALICYLKRYNKLAESDVYYIDQGESMGQPSLILGKFNDGRIWIGGQASKIYDKDLEA